MKTKNDFAGSAKYYDTILNKKDYTKNADFVAKILKKNEVTSVLEIACGTGLYLFPLKKKGFDIDGLDIGKKMLDVARKSGFRGKLYKKDMSEFNLGKKYDSILILNSGLILLPNMKLIGKTLRKSKEHLKENGLLLIDLPNHSKEIKECKNAVEIERYKISGGKMEVTFRDYKKGNKWISDWKGVVKIKGKKDEKFSEYYEELIYSVREMERLIKKNGFKILKVYGSRRGSKFDSHKSWRRFYVLKKVK